jgi:hypothetical protein
MRVMFGMMRVGYRNARDLMVASGGDRLVLMDEPSQPITPDDILNRTRRPGEVPLGQRGP